MSKHKLLNLAFSIMIAASLLFAGSSRVSADKKDPPPPNDTKRKNKIPIKTGRMQQPARCKRAP